MRKDQGNFPHPLYRAGLNYIIGVGGTMAFIILGKGFSYFFQLMLTYKFGAAVAGIFTIWFTCTHILSFLSRWGLDVLVVQLIPKYKTNVSKQWYTIRTVLIHALKTTIISAGIWFIIHGWIANHIFNNSILVFPFLTSVFIILPFNFLFLFSGILRGFKKFYHFAFLQHFLLHFFSFFILFLGSQFLFQDTPDHFPIFAFGAGITFSTFVGLVFIFRQYPSHTSLVPTEDKILKLGTPFALSNLAYFLLSWMDALLIGIFLTEEIVGMFNLILRIAMVISLPVLGINSISGPRISDAYFSKSLARLKKNILLTVIIGLITSIPIFAGILLFHEKILGSFGPEFAVCAVPLLILAGSQFIHAATGSAGLSLQMIDRAKDFQHILTGSVILKLILGIILIPAYGLLGAALNMFIITIIWKSTTWFMLIKRFKAISTSFRAETNV